MDRDQRVVVKAARLDEDPEEVATIKEEIQIQRQLAHDNTVPLLYAAETPSEVVLVMPFAAGGDLHAAMGPRGMLSEKQAARLCGQLLEGLRYLHEDLYILHGDVKPRNIFLVPAGSGLVVQLGDFGLARECPRKAPFLCHFAGLQGSHGYMAPEILSEQDYGRPVDIFALGVIIFTLLAGYEPFYPPSNVRAPLEFDPPSWEPLSKESAEFVTDMLRVAAEERLSSSAARDHTWLQMDTFSDASQPAHVELTFHRAGEVQQALAETKPA